MPALYRAFRGGATPFVGEPLHADSERVARRASRMPTPRPRDAPYAARARSAAAFGDTCRRWLRYFAEIRRAGPRASGGAARRAILVNGKETFHAADDGDSPRGSRARGPARGASLLRVLRGRRGREALQRRDARRAHA